ncbi:DUF4367 domain-containing protein [Pontibacillus marinus]|uniref:DUF4367 domain-containing protein n=1 Tax=Pontibacillus marinus BH030004 = DSM 16465 TaxID=1385511 RepID=A0A0A5I2Y2_9BACI|nr:DUF4367 domain-containing protein [Pontibacillus marinus]KGX90202.1 hypothetical protein N783_01535 [Pontibacillus marinus BH030004 = DSM 16465]
MKHLHILFILLFMVGCSGDQMHTYNTSKLKHEITKLNFNPMIPKTLPFKPENIKIKTPEMGGGRMLSVKFYNEDNDYLLLGVMKGQRNVIDFTQDKVVINDSLTGKYGVGPNGGKVLKWEKEDIFYQLSSPQNFSKDQLIDVAESFVGVEK